MANAPNARPRHLQPGRCALIRTPEGRARPVRAEVGQAAWLSVLGAVGGLMLAGGVGAVTQSMLVGVQPIDPIAFGGTAVVFAIVLGIAAWAQARRAATTNPARG